MGSQQEETYPEKGSMDDYQRILSSNGIKDKITSLLTSPPSLPGVQGLGSDCYQITLKHGHLKPPRHLFEKRASPNPPDFFREAQLFHKESNFANLLLPELKAQASKYGLELDFFPTYYHADEGRIIMEDLAYNGYEQVSKLVKLDMKYAEHVLDKLALFHSLTYNGGGENSHYMNKYPFLEERLYTAGKEWFDISYDNLLLTRQSILRASGLDGAEEACAFLQQGFGRVFNHVRDALGQHLFPVVNLGDCWISNLLFKEGEGAGDLKHVFLDFQLTRLGSPCLDLSYFLTTSLKPALLLTNWPALLNFYYTKLIAYVQKQGKEFHFSFEQLQQEFKTKLNFAFWLNMTFFTGFDLFPHLDMGRIEREVGCGTEIVREWITKNPGRVRGLAGEVLLLIDFYKDVFMME